MRRIALVLTFASLSLVPAKPPIEWPYYGADQAGTKYSAASDINRANVERLAVAWSWKPNEKPLPEFGT